METKIILTLSFLLIVISESEGSPRNERLNPQQQRFSKRHARTREEIKKDGNNGLPRVCRTEDDPFNYDHLPPCYDLTMEDIIEARLVEGIEDRPEGEVLLPPWVNIPLVKKGQEFAKKYLFSVMLSHLFGLFSSTYPDGYQVISFTTMSDTRERSAKRYIATLNHVLIWYFDALNSKGRNSMSAEKDFIKSLMGVRQRHIAASNAVKDFLNENGYVIPDGKYDDYEMDTVVDGAYMQDLKAAIPPFMQVKPPSNFDTGEYEGINPFNQQMNLLTQFAFAGYVVLFPERLGIVTATDEELWAFTHLWAVIGWGQGIKDKYNICLQKDLATTRRLFLQIWETYNIPALFHMTRDVKAFMELTLYGTKGVVSGVNLSPNLQLYWMMKHLMQIPAPRVKEQLSISDKLLDTLLNTMYMEQYKYNPIQRNIMNGVALSAFKLAGVQQFGKRVFSTQSSRARNVFWSNYE